MRPPTAGRVPVGGRGLARAAIRATAIAPAIAHVPEDRLAHGRRARASRSRPTSSSRRTATATCRAGPFLRRRRIAQRARRAHRALRRAGAGPGDAGARSSRAATCRRSCWRASSPASRACSSPRRRRAASTSAPSRRCTSSCATRPRAASAVLLITEDLDEMLALADRVLVMYEGAIVGERDAGAPTSSELGLLMAGGERPLIRIERRARDAALAAGGRADRLARGRARVLGVVLLGTGHNPCTTYRRLFEAAFTAAARSRRRSRRRRRSASPGSPRRWRSAWGCSTSAPRASSTWARSARPGVALCPGRAGARASIAAMVDRRRRSPARPGRAIPGVLRAFANTNEIITSLMLNYVAGALPQLPDLRHALVLARHVRPGAGCSRRARRLPEAATGRRSTLGTVVDPVRLLRRGRCSRASSGCCTSGRASASRRR